MELKQYLDKSWRIYHRGKMCGFITDYGKEWLLQLNYRPYEIPKNWMTKEELKDLVRRMIEFDEHEVYSEIKAEKRGFKILR